MVPFQATQAIFGIRLYLSTGGMKGRSSLKSQVTGKSDQQMGLWLTITYSKERLFARHPEKQQAKDAVKQFFPKSLQAHNQNKTQPNLSVFGKWETRHLYCFGGMDEKELKTSQLRMLRSVYPILRGTKMWLEGYLYFHQPFLLSTRVLQNGCMKLLRERGGTCTFCSSFSVQDLLPPFPVYVPPLCLPHTVMHEKIRFKREELICFVFWNYAQWDTARNTEFCWLDTNMFYR